MRPAPRKTQSGQAFIEFTFVTFMLVAMLFALIDYTRAVYERQVLVNLTREGSNLYSRGTSATNTMDAIFTSASPLDLSAKGKVILTQVYNNNGTLVVSNQMSRGSFSATSKIGAFKGTPKLPLTPTTIPTSNSFLYVTEVYYSYSPITPVGKLLKVALPTSLYDVAYF